jgi:hypothetical protein
MRIGDRSVGDDQLAAGSVPGGVSQVGAARKAGADAPLRPGRKVRTTSSIVPLVHGSATIATLRSSGLGTARSMNTESRAAKSGTSRPPLRRLTSVRHVSGTGPHPKTSLVHLAGVDAVATTSPDWLPLTFKNPPVIVLTVVIVCNLRPSRSENAARTVFRPHAHAGTKDTNSPVAELLCGRSARALESASPDARSSTATSNADPAPIPRILGLAGRPEARERNDCRISITNSTVDTEPCHPRGADIA